LLLRDEGWEPGQDAVRLLASALVAVVAVGLKLVVVRWLGGDLGYLSYVGAVALGAWIAGLRGGLLTTALCAVAEAAIFGGSSAAGLASANALLGLGLFVFDGILVSLITSALRQATHRERVALARSEQILHEQRSARGASERSQAELVALQAATATLAGAATPADVATAILDRGLEVLGAVAGGVSRLDPSGRTVEVIASRGYTEPEARAGHRFDLDGRSHLRDAVVSGRPIFLGQTEAWLSLYPESPPRQIPGSPAEGALAVLPLVSGRVTLGAVVFRFDRAVDFDAGVGELAVRLAEHGAQAMDRALAYDREHTARLDLERSRDRLAFLALAGERLASRADIGSSLAEIADLAVPLLADWCLVQLTSRERPVVAVAAAPAERRPIVARLASLVRANHNLGAWLAPDLIADGAALVTPGASWSERLADTAAAGELDGLQAKALLVAIVEGADGTSMGAVVLGSARSDRFDAADVPMVRNLAERIGTAARQADLLAVVTRFKASVDESADAVYFFDPHTLELTYVNRGGADLAGSAPEELLGQSITQLQPAAGAAVDRLRSESLDGGRLAYATTLRRADGRDVPIEAFLQAVSLGDGTTSIILTARDISERLKVQARLTRIAGDERRQAAELRAVIQAMHEGIVVVGPDGAVSLANEAAMTILGGELPADLEDLRRRIGVPSAEPGSDTVEPGLDGDRDTDGTAVGDGRSTVRLDDGRWLESAIYPAELGSSVADGATSTIVVLRDVSRAKEAEAAREAFLGVLSHELRTPVTTIFGYAKVLQRRSHRADRAEMLNDIEVEADRLYRIVEDLLALSRVEGGVAIEGEPILIQHAIEPLMASEAQRWPGIRYQSELPAGLPTARGERTYVEQVLRNLLSNAGKYSRPNSVVTITAEESPTEVLVRILDRGIGITEDETDRLFELFYRSPTTSRSATGAGIGLYVGRGLVTAMGGRIWARPREGGGSEFGFSLPRFEEDTPPSPG